jgi:hypothetical protein
MVRSGIASGRGSAPADLESASVAQAGTEIRSDAESLGELERLHKPLGVGIMDTNAKGLFLVYGPRRKDNRCHLESGPQ